MPNHVTNQLTILSAVKGAVKSFYESLKRTNEDGKEEYYFDFEKFFPMPEDLHISDSSLGDKAMRFLKEFEGREYTDLDLKEAGLDEEDIELGKKYASNIKKYGHKTWYNWAISNWGTKWNSYDNVIAYEKWSDTLYIEFNTAWSAPLPVIEEFVKQNPALEGIYVWADEDSGYNTGRGSFVNGDLKTNKLEDNSDNAWNAFFETHQNYRDEYVYTADKGWTYDDGEQETVEAPVMTADNSPVMLKKARTLLAMKLSKESRESYDNWNEAFQYKHKYEETLKELNGLREKLGLPIVLEVKEEENL